MALHLWHNRRPVLPGTGPAHAAEDGGGILEDSALHHQQDLRVRPVPAPLALACAYSPDPLFKKALRDQASYLRSRTDGCGAIQEEGSNIGHSVEGGDLGLTYNADEKISDQLYCTSFAAMNYWIAYKATGERAYLEDFVRTADYLVRIQVESPDAMIDGGWMRGFDYSLWEYYGSNADQGWNAYCLENRLDERHYRHCLGPISDGRFLLRAETRLNRHEDFAMREPGDGHLRHGPKLAGRHLAAEFVADIRVELRVDRQPMVVPTGRRRPAAAPVAEKSAPTRRSLNRDKREGNGTR